uniref:S1 motif domain-containing protein n=1 Tax=Megaviridae environmental sample TaxID=1737588 RepID=A0A5J6VL10_9VIRU|nr:MAG: hypothetical protein [Megaviridae environmental sample]
MQLYKNKLPEIDDIVNFKAEKKNDYGFNCTLIDYGIEGLLPINLITKKKRIKNINTLIPLNKTLQAYVNEITNNIITLNIVLLDKTSDKYQNFVKVNEDNKKLHTLIKRYCYKYNKDINILWKPIQELDISNKLEYTYKNIDNLELELKKFILDNKKIAIKNYEKKIAINTLDDINVLKLVVQNIIIDNNLNVIITVDKLPIYKIQSDNIDNCNLFINKLFDYSRDKKRIFLTV